MVGYASDTIAASVGRLNVQYFLPAPQREFVWRQDQIIQLFDSIMRGYPISSFLFWQLESENYENWNIFQFIGQYKKGDHNPPASSEGVHQLTLILDGQQRLTSLLIGLKGSYANKKKKSSDAWVKQYLHLDLLNDPKVPDENGEEGNRYGFKFSQDPPNNDDKHYWLKVGKILNLKTDDMFHDFKSEEVDQLPDTIMKKQVKVFEKNLDRLYWAIWKEKVINYYTEVDQDYDKVLDIFVRANSGGTKLSKSDLLLSMVSSDQEWKNAREDIFYLVDYLNSEFKNEFNKDFIMKTCLVLSGLEVQYKVKNFNKKNLKKIKENWKDIEGAIKNGVQLAYSFGINGDVLISANALIPILYYLYKNPGMTLLEQTPFSSKNAARIHTWLVMALLNNMFSGQSDQALDLSRQVLDKEAHQKDFPSDALNNSISKILNKKTSFDDDTMEGILELTYQMPATFLALSLLYDNRERMIFPVQKDHIFPQALFDEKTMNDAGINDPKKQILFKEYMDRIGNLELLISGVNEKKSDEPLDTWIATRIKSFRDTHLIPSDEALYQFSQFDKFIEKREEMIRDHLKHLFIRTK
jgi:uncharacterized protein with ParB-like and HNH nuclease domain